MNHTIHKPLSMLLGALLYSGCIQAAPFQGDVADVAVDVAEPSDASGGDTVAQDTTLTDTPVPDATEPDGVNPDATDATEPDATEPDTADPDATEPDATDPDATEPDATDPDATDPDATEPDVSEPDAVDPDATQPDADVGCTPDCSEKLCGDDGCGGTCGDCQAGTYCSDDQQCDQQVCPPEEKYCDGDVSKTCNEDGSGADPEASTTNCPASLLACIEATGVCGCAPNCEGKTCGDDGCDGVCGECGDDETCDQDGSLGQDTQGTCVAHVCEDGYLVCSPTSNSEIVFCKDGFYPTVEWINEDPEMNIQFDCAGPLGVFEDSVCTLPSEGASLIDAIDELGDKQACSCEPGGKFCYAGGNGDCSPDQPCTIAVECKGLAMVAVDCSDPQQANQSDMCSFGSCQPENSCGQNCGLGEICYGTNAGVEPEDCQSCDEFCQMDWVKCSGWVQGNNGNGACDCTCEGPDCTCEGPACIGGFCAGETCSLSGDMKCWGDGTDPSYLRCQQSGANLIWVEGDCLGGKVCDEDNKTCSDPQNAVGDTLCGWTDPSEAFLYEPDACEGEACVYTIGGVCAVGPDSDAQSRLRCKYDMDTATYRWLSEPCGDPKTCTADNECKNHYYGDPGWCGPNSSGAVKCLYWGAILRCKMDSNLQEWAWIEETACPVANEICVMDACVGPGEGQPPQDSEGCLVESSDATQFCSSISGDPECCAEDYCVMVGSVCANTNAHTVLSCNGMATAVVATICEIGQTCVNSGDTDFFQASCESNSGPPGGSTCDGCTAQNLGSMCKNDQCVSCIEVCAPEACGQVIGQDEKGACDCGTNNCSPTEPCDYAQNLCTPTNGCGEPQNLCTESCGSVEDPCGPTQFCGAQCGFGGCGDDYAVDVLQDPQTEHIYVIGRQCGVAGCFLRVDRLASSGALMNRRLLSADDWFLGASITTPTAGALRNGKLLVVGSTQSSATALQRFGFIALFDVTVASDKPVLVSTYKAPNAGEFLDVAATNEGHPVVAGFVEPGGIEEPDARNPWAMRFQVVAGDGVSPSSSWTNLQFSNESGSCSSEMEDRLVSVEILDGYPNAYLFAGTTYDPSEEGFVGCVIQLDAADGSVVGLTNPSLPAETTDVHVARMRMAGYAKNQPFKGLLMGAAAMVDGAGQKQVRPYAQHFEFDVSSSGTSTVVGIADMEFDVEVNLSDLPGEAIIHDTCFDPNGSLWLVGEAPSSGAAHMLPSVARFDPLSNSVTNHLVFQNTPVSQYTGNTNDRFRTCAVITEESDQRLMMVGDLQEITADDGGDNDTLMVDLSLATSPPELVCSGSL